MKKILPVSIITALLWACSGGSAPKGKTPEAQKMQADYDAKKGVGKFTHVEIPATLDPAMATAGQKIYDLKCGSCHKLTEEKLVGPGWKDVTKRRQPEWILNFVTNVAEMLEKDPAAQAQLEICMVKMPDQNLSEKDARDIYEFMRKNDGVK